MLINFFKNVFFKLNFSMLVNKIGSVLSNKDPNVISMSSIDFAFDNHAMDPRLYGFNDIEFLKFAVLTSRYKQSPVWVNMLDCKYYNIVVPFFKKYKDVVKCDDNNGNNGFHYLFSHFNEHHPVSFERFARMVVEIIVETGLYMTANNIGILPLDILDTCTSDIVNSCVVSEQIRIENSKVGEENESYSNTISR